MRSVRLVSAALLSIPLATACVHRPEAGGDEHAGHIMTPAATMIPAPAPAPAGSVAIPAGASDAKARLAASPRHGEWVMIATGVDGSDSVRAWVVYPQRPDKAPVIVVVHEIFGLSTWVRNVADQLAADGYIAIAPDLLTNKHVPGSPDSISVDSAVAAIRTLKPQDVQRQLDAVAAYGMKLPSALPKYGIVGFCWGGSTVFAHAVHASSLGAAVVYYGGAPQSAELASVRAPVVGFYGGSDARVNATIPPADSAMKALGKTYEHTIFAGAGHGFLRAQTEPGGANLEASTKAWPATIAWFRKYLGA